MILCRLGRALGRAMAEFATAGLGANRAERRGAEAMLDGDGWHVVVGQWGANGARLYIDGR